MNNWRMLLYRPGAAHLWEPTPSGLERSRCGRMTVSNLAVTTIPLEPGMDSRKCRGCVQFELRRAESNKKPGGNAA